MLSHLSQFQRPFVIIAHRGATTNQDLSRVTPENTMPAFLEAQKQGAAIELDVMTTRDGTVVVYHDFKTGRTFRLPEQQKPVRQTDWHELQKARFNAAAHEREIQRMMGPSGNYKSPQWFEGLQVPSLDAVLTDFPNTRFCIELKTVNPFASGQLERKVARLIREKNLYDRVTVLSFSPVSLRKIKRYDPQIKTALNVQVPDLVKQWPVLLKGFIKLYAQRWVGVDAIQPSYSDTTPALVEIAHSAGLPVVAWASSETREEERQKFPQLMAMGVDGLITNAVDLLNAAVKDRPLPLC
ncbi:glycerophosphodiester phosphodiesterase [Vampirovibrio chlorellavorus]|uniref:glycerophosphodiester phosphodiesterase n=1 Tax=Vampirovibrio chlorellavorus TaxID=758823 RepID=UPI0026F368AE|nr:glycerophosphodiester phosphodiesterase family protein [Vampirovibrio chlorellavorus]